MLPICVIKNQSFFLSHKTILDPAFREFPELKPPKGKFRIIGIEKFKIPGEGHWVVEDLGNCEQESKRDD